MNLRHALTTALIFGFSAVALHAAAQEVPTEATTAKGERVFLYQNGRWEYADQKKAEVQRKAVEVEQKREASAQGGLFGIGRRIHEGDRDYNRGSLNPKLR